MTGNKWKTHKEILDFVIKNLIKHSIVMKALPNNVTYMIPKGQKAGFKANRALLDI